MKFIDSNQLLVLSADEICALPQEKLQNPDNFAAFAKGIKIDPELLFSDKWQNASIGQDYKSLFGFVMKEMLPAFYDYNYLLANGEVGISITGIANYTLSPVNGRVVGMDGLPVDYVTGEETFSFSINPDMLMAFCRGLTLEASESFLSDDDEWEDREISSTELSLYGMPAGGSDVATACWDASECVSDMTIGSDCYANASACLGNSVPGGNGCGMNTNICGVNAGGVNGCYANGMVCGADVTAGTACGTAVGVCTANVTGGAVCGADASACGANVDTGAACGAKAGACGVDILGLCPANAVVCGINLPGDIVGACGINVLPLLPSC